MTQRGWRQKLGGGGDYCKVVFVCPHPHILPTQLQLPPHPAQPGAGSSCGGTRTRDRSGTFRCPSAPGTFALVPRSGPRHPGSQCRVLLCHTDLDKFLADSATLYPNSGLKWRCKTPDSTPVLVYRGYRCRNEVFSSLHNSDSQGCANTFAKRVPRQLCIPAGTQELVRNTLGTKQT